MDTVLALDIGTEYIKAALARANKSHLEIVGTGKAKQEPGSMWNGTISDIPAVVAACEKAIVSAEEQSEKRASAVVVGIAGELVKGNTTAVHYTRENPNKPITESEMDEIIKKVQQKSGEVAKETVALETGNNSIEIRLINSAIVSLTIDGYKINNPIGFKGSDVVIQFYTAFAPLVHIAAIEKVCAELNLDLIAVAVEPFAVCRACLGDNLNSNFSGIIMDIGSCTTDVAVINDGGIIGTETFNIGGKNANANPKIWLAGVEVALEDIKTTNTLPNNIWLCGGSAGLPNLQEALALSNWYQNLPFTKRPLVDLITPDTLPDLNIKTELGPDFVTAIGLLRVGTDVISNQSEENHLKDKISKLLQK